MPDDGDLSKLIPLIQKLSGGNNETGDFGYTADNIRPRRRPVYSTPPIYNSKIVLGLDRPDTTFYTTTRCWALKPSREYPTTTIRLSFSNAKSNTFSTVSIEEIGQLMSFFEKCYKELSIIKDNLKPLEESMKSLNEKTDLMYKDIVDEHLPEVAKILEENADKLGD